MMAQDPYLIRAMARRLAADLQLPGRTNLAIKVHAFATLNGRPGQRLIDPDADLAKARGTAWILPLVDQRADEPSLLGGVARERTFHDRGRRGFDDL
jgi:hypothetical protein